jgi:hypothetical protein
MWTGDERLMTITQQMPLWLEQAITVKTGVAPGMRNATPDRCRHCHASTLTGLDDDHAAFIAHVNPTPINAVGEALARLHNLRTYALRSQGGKLQLHIRDHWQINGSPAGSTHSILRFDTVADHSCGIELPSIPSIHQPTRKAARNDQPPF